MPGIRRMGTNGLTGGLLLALLILIAVFGPLLAGNPLKMDIPHRLQLPSADHPMGTDEFGRDILARVVHGARISLVVGIAVVAVGLGLGTLLGVAAAYRGGTFALILMGLVDLMLA